MSKKSEEKEIVEVTNAGNQNLLYIIIIILLIIIAIWGFFLWMQLGKTNAPVQTIVQTSTGTTQTSPIATDITVTIYDDKRCTDCQTDVVLEQLKWVPVLAAANFIEREFSEDGVSEFLETNGITALPAAIFSTNNVWSELAQYLSPLDSGEFSLALWASHNPFVERSDNGFLIAEPEVLTEIKETAYFKWPDDAKITWVEYTDVNCGYCKKMETDGTANAVLAKFPEELNKTSSNYVWVGGAATQKAAEILECAGKLWWAELFNSMISQVLTDWDNSEEAMLAFAAEQWADRDTIKSCLDNGETKDIVAQKFATWAETFGITGTPGNVLINNETWEYEIVSGAYPADKFIETVNKLLGNS